MSPAGRTNSVRSPVGRPEPVAPSDRGSGSFRRPPPLFRSKTNSDWRFDLRTNKTENYSERARNRRARMCVSRTNSICMEIRGRDPVGLQPADESPRTAVVGGRTVFGIFSTFSPHNPARAHHAHSGPSTNVPNGGGGVRRHSERKSERARPSRGDRRSAKWKSGEKRSNPFTAPRRETRTMLPPLQRAFDRVRGSRM